MRKKALSMLLVSILFLYLLTSCGQPSYHDYSNEISVSRFTSRSIGGESYDAGFRVHVDSNLIGLGGSTPSILLMYCISPSNDSLSNYFNQYIRGTNNYYNGATATFNSNGELDNVVGNYEGEELHLYAFKGENQLPLSSSPSYTVSIPLDIGERAQYYFIMVRRSGEESDNRFHLILDCYAGDSYSGSDARKVRSKDLYRYPGGSNSQFFRNTSDAQGQVDYSFYSGSDEANHQIQIALAVNLIPVNTGYNNIYWSNLVFDYIRIE